MATQAEPPPDRALLWPHEAARALGMHPSRLRGRLPSVRTPGGHRRYHRHDVEQAARELGLAWVIEEEGDTADQEPAR